MIRRVGRPGLIGLAARTAVVAGTASAVSGAMAGNRQRKAQSQYEQEQYEAAQQQAAASDCRPSRPSNSWKKLHIFGENV